MNLCLIPILAVIVNWSPNPPSEGVTGYNVYWGTNSGSYQAIAMVATNSININLPPGKVYLAVQALTPTRQSALSTEISFTVIEVSQSLQQARFIEGPWTTKTNFPMVTVVETNDTQLFFRGVTDIKR